MLVNDECEFTMNHRTPGFIAFSEAMFLNIFLKFQSQCCIRVEAPPNYLIDFHDLLWKTF